MTLPFEERLSRVKLLIRMLDGASSRLKTLEKDEAIEQRGQIASYIRQLAGSLKGLRRVAAETLEYQRSEETQTQYQEAIDTLENNYRILTNKELDTDRALSFFGRNFDTINEQLASITQLTGRYYPEINPVIEEIRILRLNVTELEKEREILLSRLSRLKASIRRKDLTIQSLNRRLEGLSTRLGDFQSKITDLVKERTLMQKKIQQMLSRKMKMKHRDAFDRERIEEKSEKVVPGR
ncbi:MAG: hypothetical protein ACFFBS_06145 [Promethearchaeota archaeon]